MAYLINQNFEGTGFDNGESWLEWTGGTLTTGVLDPNYATGPLRGDQSLRIKDDANYGIAAVSPVFGGDNGYNALYGFFRLKLIDMPSATSEIQTHYNNQDYPDTLDYHEVLSVTPAGYWYVQNLTGVQGATPMGQGTPYYVWWYIEHDADKKSSGWIKFGESLTIPETNDVSWSNKDVYDAVNSRPMMYRGTNCVGFTSQHGNSYEYLVDQAIVSDTPIGSMDEAASTYPFWFYPS